MDALMAVVAEAISQSERKAATAPADAKGDAPEMREMLEAETTQAREAEREAAAKRRASNFLQAMGSPGGEQTREFSREDYGKRRARQGASSREVPSSG